MAQNINWTLYCASIKLLNAAQVLLACLEKNRNNYLIIRMRNVTSRKASFNNIHFPGNNLANVIFSYLVQAPEKASQGYFFRKTI